MTLLSGAELDPALYFASGTPCVQGSSFDLTIGKIFKKDGTEAQGPFILKPGEMVQVVSAEVFKLPDNITGHVTYKTSLTREGIWALTVGIVDPGWDGPVATTLLNFSRIDHTIHAGDSFLRVSLFKHHPVEEKKLRKAKPPHEYLKEIQTFAAARFPSTFLNSDQIATDAGQAVLTRIRNEGLAWLGAIVIVFTLIQVFAVPAAKWVDTLLSPTSAEELSLELKNLRERLEEIERKKYANENMQQQNVRDMFEKKVPDANENSAGQVKD